MEQSHYISRRNALLLTVTLAVIVGLFGIKAILKPSTLQSPNDLQGSTPSEPKQDHSINPESLALLAPAEVLALADPGKKTYAAKQLAGHLAKAQGVEGLITLMEFPLGSIRDEALKFYFDFTKTEDLPEALHLLELNGFPDDIRKVAPGVIARIDWLKLPVSELVRRGGSSEHERVQNGYGRLMGKAVLECGYPALLTELKSMPPAFKSGALDSAVHTLLDSDFKAGLASLESDPSALEFEQWERIAGKGIESDPAYTLSWLSDREFVEKPKVISSALHSWLKRDLAQASELIRVAESDEIKDAGYDALGRYFLDMDQPDDAIEWFNKRKDKTKFRSQ